MDTDYAVPPGATLREWLEENNQSQAELAEACGWSPKHVSQMINGKVSLSIKSAVKLGQRTGTPTSFWARLEAQFRADVAEGKHITEIEPSKTKVGRKAKPCSDCNDGNCSTHGICQCENNECYR